MIYQVTYFLGPKVFEVGSLDSNMAPHSVAYFCATCGQVWGRAYVEATTWTTFTVPCERHEKTGVPDWSSIPGSFIAPAGGRRAETSTMFWSVCVDSLPPRLLDREFNLMLSHLDKGVLNDAR